jgi:uncharacterized protein (DUF2235 family)
MSAKRLVVCTDGTWNDPVNGRATNVLKLARAVKRFDAKGVPQVVYYHPGVGTGTDFVDRLLGGATGFGISRNIRDAYGFLVLNYEPGDEIFLFGFSRGAYTARSLAGLIRNSGILRPECGHLFGDAYEIYRSRAESDRPNAPEAVEFREKNSHRETRIKFVGVWDTVGALGIPLGIGRSVLKLLGALRGRPYLYEFHNVELSSFVDHAYHALAIDEKREPFRPTLWSVSPETPRAPTQSFEQVWFPGVHCDVGGGEKLAGLSDLALEWMSARARRHGLELDLEVLCPPFCPRSDGHPGSSQTWLYRALAVARKVNALTLRLGLKAADIEDLRRVDWRGDYHRPVGPRFDDVEKRAA